MKPTLVKILFLSLCLQDPLSAMEVEETPSVQQTHQEQVIDILKPIKKRKLYLTNSRDLSTREQKRQKRDSFNGFDICARVPPEVMSLIFDKLSLKNLFNIRLACSYFKRCSLRTDPDPFRGRDIYPMGWLLFYPNLKYLKSSGFRKEKERGLTEYLTSHPTLQKLVIKESGFDCESAELLSKMLETNGSITSLTLEYCEIGSYGANCLAEMLKKNSAITTLKLGGNCFGKFGVKCITMALKKNTTLTCLKLKESDIGKNGSLEINYLRDMLMTNTSLKELDLSWNKIGDNQLKMLILSLEKNQSLTKLDLSWNDFSEVGIQTLCKMLESNSTLVELNLKENPCGIGAILSVAEMLLVNSSLKSLLLSNHYVYLHPNDQVTQALMQSLRNNTTLETLHVPKVYLSPEQANEFKGRITLT